MTRQQLLTAVAAKPSVIRVIGDTLTHTTENIEKRLLDVLTDEGGGNAQIYNVYYLWDKVADVAWFQQADVLAAKDTQTTASTKAAALQNFLANNYYAWKVEILDGTNNFAIATVYVDGASLAEKRVVVKKVGASLVAKDIA